MFFKYFGWGFFGHILDLGEIICTCSGGCNDTGRCKKGLKYIDGAVENR